MNFLEIFRYRTGADLKFVSVDRFMLYDLKLKRVVKDISVPQDRLVIGYHFRTKEDFPFPRGKPYSVISLWGLPYPICTNDGGEIEFWDVREGSVLRSIKISKISSLQQLLQEPSSRAVVGSLLPGNQIYIEKGNNAIVFDSNNGELIESFPLGIRYLPSPFNGTEVRWVSRTADSVVFKGVPSGQTVRQIPIGPLRDVWSSEDNDYIIVVQEQQVRVWRIRNLADLLR